MPSLTRKAILSFGFSLLLLVALFASISMHSFQQPLDSVTDARVFEVSPGSSLTRITNDLTEQGILTSPLFFRIAARWEGVEADLQTGEYRIEPGISTADLLAKMVAGDVIQYRVTLLEGWTITEVMEALARQPELQQTLGEASATELAEALELESTNPEGMLHPETYFYIKGTTDLELLRRARIRQETILQEHWQNRLGALPFNSPYEALILASIIEKESAATSERGHIAGVFVRRLEQGMRLQSDPTVIYGIGEDFDGNLTREHLRTTTAYNTYRISGLPPSPIALPGETSIIASLNPLPGDSLYFVSRGDGTHYFSATLEEHNAAVNRFQRQANTEQDGND